MLRPLSALAAAACAAALLGFAPAARAGGPTMVVGVADDFVKVPDSAVATARMRLAKLAGFDTIRITVIWSPGEKEPSAAEVAKLRNVTAAARLNAMKLIVSLHNFGSRTTPLTEESRAEFVEYAGALTGRFPAITDLVVGNEPNLNRFWLPQFGEDGSNVAAPAYLQLLAETYDALKASRPKLSVWGGALAPRGVDRPGTGRDTHSPTRFLRDMGAAYRESARDRPVMDGLAIHPYGDSSSQAPVLSSHPNNGTVGLADYGKLVRVLGESFDGTAQRGSSLPILYDEFGVESIIPAGRARAYTGSEPAATRPVDEATQALYYRQAMELAFCQPNVRGLVLFHVADEPARAGWQSGLMYADLKAKTSLKQVRAAIGETKRGVVAGCIGLRLVPAVRKAVWPRGTALQGKQPLRFRLQCTLDCTVVARLVPAAGGRVALTGRAVVTGGKLMSVRLPTKPVRPGSYVLRLALTHPVNPGRVRTLVSPALRLPRGLAWRSARPQKRVASPPASRPA